MKEQKNLPVIILNEGNLDFIFDMFDRESYRIGLGEDPGIENDKMREFIREDIKKWNTENNPAISFVEIDPVRKRYINLTKWFQPTEREFINEHINYPYSESVDYWEQYKKNETNT
jgi:hypothetical protein